jgi:hypothetical protein
MTQPTAPSTLAISLSVRDWMDGAGWFTVFHLARKARSVADSSVLLSAGVRSVES